MEHNKQHIQSYLQRISDILLINGGFLDNPGLYAGEMGLALFFSRYARFTKNELYLNYSYDLIEKVQSTIHQDTPINYNTGLAGIGSAIEYLVQNGFFEADTDELLEDFDKRLFASHNLPYLSGDEIAGTGYYAIWRLSGNSGLKDPILKTILPQIVHAMEDWCTAQNSTHPTVSFLRDFVSSENLITIHAQSSIPVWYKLRCDKESDSLSAKSYDRLLENFSKNDFLRNNNLNLGIQNGLAGLGIFLLTELDGDDSWTALFPNDFNTFKNESLPL